ncbi:MAG: Xaa-Pro peptidase family protein [Spirochaetota bacterium]
MKTVRENCSLPGSEYERRLRVVRRGMDENDLDALIVYSWKRGQVRYISGYQPDYVANVAMVVVPKEGEPVLLIRFPFDLERARRCTWLEDVRVSGDWSGFVRDCRQILTEKRIDESRIGLISGDFVVNEMPFTLYQALTSSMPGTCFIPAISIFEKARLIKSDTECRCIKLSAEIADQAVISARNLISHGRTEYEVTATAEKTARERGAEDYLAVIAPGSSELIRPPEPRSIELDEMVVFEFAVQAAGYWTQTACVFHSGKPTEEQREMYRVAYEGYRAGVDAARPGNTISDIAKAELSVLERAGWLKWREYDLGHGDGLDHPEIPAIAPENDTVVKPGMVLCLHPGLRKPGVGGAFVGGMVIVGEDKTEPLNSVPPEIS